MTLARAAKEVIDKLGGIKIVSEVTEKDFSTVYRWTKEPPEGIGYIPDDSKRVLKAYARRKRIRLRWDDFFPADADAS